ncbi:hypothetical protein BCS42_02125 [Crenothrix sp. D3]|nr:hypothetical protein BCS42_02125 [Crenothrix sp. D3]
MLKDYKLSNSDFFSKHSATIKLILFIVFSAVFFGAVTYKIILIPNGPVHEYDAHILATVKMFQEKRIINPHFLFQLLTIIHYYLLSFLHLPTYQITGVNQIITYDWGFTAFIVMLEVYIGIELLLFYHFRLKFQSTIKNSENIAYLIAFGVSICTPIFLLAPFDGKFYLGYVTPATIYIISSQVLLKLPSLALFILSPLYFTKNKDNATFLLTIAVLVILSGLAKPNWLIVMLPALGIVTLIHLFKRSYINWWALIVIIMASAVVLGWQYYFTFTNASPDTYKSKIIITAPFEVLGYYSDFIFIKIILSILFPLYITVFFWKTIKQDFLFSYGWIVFLIGMVYSGFFGEAEPYKFAGNFCWSGQIACFMLFVSAASVFFANCVTEYPKDKQKIILGVALFCAHVICGLIYYFRAFESSFA